MRRAGEKLQQWQGFGQPAGVKKAVQAGGGSIEGDRDRIARGPHGGSG